MGSYRCIVCTINYPQDAVGDKKCPACGEDLVWRPLSKPHENWRDLVAARAADDNYLLAPDIWVRAERLTNCGLDTGTALMWASSRAPLGGYALDTHDFEKEYNALRGAGCAHELAIRILAPVEF